MRLSLWLSLLPLSLLQCTPDERQLAAGARSDSVAEAGSSAGAAGADPESFAGEDGGLEIVAGSVGVAGAGGRAVGGPAAGTAAGTGGTSIVDPGGNGTSNAGGAPGGASGKSGNGGSGGSGGAPFDSPCGDIDHDLVDDCSETLLLNSRFDTATANWTAPPNVLQVWDSRDALGKPGSGSLVVTNQTPVAAADAWVLAGTDQCIPVTESIEYQLAARVMIPDGQGPGSAGLNLYAFTGAACAGIFVSGLATPVTLQRGVWSVVAAQVEMPAAAHSVLVRLAVSKPFTQAKLIAFFDDVLVRAVH